MGFVTGFCLNFKADRYISKRSDPKMPERYADIKNKLCELAEKDEDIRAVIAIGSYTRKDISTI